MDGNAEILDVPRACLEAFRGEKTQVLTAADSAQAPGSGTREQFDGSSRDKKRSTVAAKEMNQETRAVYLKL